MQIEEPVQLQFHCYRKGKTGIKKYIGYVRANQLDLIKENLQIPKHSLPIQLQTHIKWEVQEEERNGKKYYKIHSFKFQQVKVINGNPITKITTFFGEEEDLIKLKEALRNKIIFQRIQDFYTPLQTLGKGASSRVLLVRHKNTEKFYAAKCVDKSYVNETENGLESMFQEISINNVLEHSSFIKLHAVYEGDNTFYMVMDLLEGRSLHEELGNNKDGYSEDTVRNIMWQILSGIEYMHQKEIMHRDLKPENIMLLKKGDLNSLKIVDFGLATYCNIEKYLFPKCGTPGYVAPEIANLVDKTLKYDKVCDIFSAGVIFFKLITGKDLFPGVGFNLVLKLNKQCKIDLTPLQIKKVDPQIIGLIQKMLEKDPQQRITATGCLQDPFFIQCYQETPIQGPQKLTPFQKKQQFSFSGKAVTQDFVIDGQKVSPVNEQEKQGSFVTQDNAYKSVEQPHLKQQKMMHKFNTTEFDHVVQTPSPNVQNKLQNFQKHDPIEEEDEK